MQCQYNQFLAAQKKTNSQNEVHEIIQQLYSFPMNGNDPKAAMEVDKKARQTVVELSRKSTRVIRLGSVSREQDSYVA